MLCLILWCLEELDGLLWSPLEIVPTMHRVQVLNSSGRNILKMGGYDGLRCAVEAGTKTERDEGYR